MAPIILPVDFCLRRIPRRSSLSRRCSAPGIPPGRTTASYGVERQEEMWASGRTVRPLDIFKGLGVGEQQGITEAVVTRQPNLFSTSVMEASSSSSVPVPRGTRTRGRAGVENETESFIVDNRKRLVRNIDVITVCAEVEVVL